MSGILGALSDMNQMLFVVHVVGKNEEHFITDRPGTN